MALMENNAVGEKPVKNPELEKFLRHFREAENELSETREFAFRDRVWTDNFNDSQWSDDEKKTMRKRGQPIVTSNRIKRKVNFLRGMEARTRTDPKAFPRGDNNDLVASVASDVLDFIDINTRFDRKASNAFENLAVEGIEAVEIVWNPDTEQVETTEIDFDSFFYDPHSKWKDFSDAQFMGYSTWFDMFDALALLGDLSPDAEDAIRNAMEMAMMDDGFEDKPGIRFGDPSRNRVRIITMYYRSEVDGTWRQTLFTGGGIIIDQDSPYEDDRGKPEPGIVAQSLYVTRQNERFGVVRDMIPLQMEMNYRRSMALHLLKNRRLWQAHKGVFDNPAAAREQVAKADGILTANGVKDSEWGFMDSTAETEGNLLLLQEAKSELDLQGPNAGLAGRNVKGQSGKAILAQQESGMIEENQLFDAHADWKLRCHRAHWNRARQFWTKEKRFRISDKDVDAGFRFTTVNTEEDQATVGPSGTQIAPGSKNKLRDMDVDIIMELVPDLMTQQHETFEQMSLLAQHGSPISPRVLLELAPHFHNKDKVLELMSAESQQANEQAAVQQEIEAKKVGVDVEAVIAKTRKTMAEVQNVQADTKKKLAETADILIGEPAKPEPARASN